ncbi:MAG TPA: hypothetical protein VHK86_03995 [Nitrososphaera sp.]|nr:hypothetical protein [Nitrososphaera sp.]
MVKARREVLAFALIAVLVFSALSYQRAFADGLTQENLPPASVGNRNASLFVKISPPILTTESKQDAFMQFRLFDANNNQTIPHTTYNIRVTKGVADNNSKPIMQDFFHSHDGLLTLKIEPKEGPLTIFGTQDPFQNAWVADPGGTVNIRGPLLLEGGLYHFQIEIFGIDNDRNIFVPDDAPKFDSWLSVGDVSTENMQYNGQPYNTTIISYYDKVQDFKFDASKKTLTWAMPFDWDVSRIQKNNIFVHEEVRIPKSLSGIGNSPYFTATANGDVLVGRKLAIDPYSSETELTLHYLLNKNDILDMAKKANADSNQMTFSLAPASEAPAETTGEMVTDIGGVGVATEWSPNPLSAGKDSTVKLHFSDAFSGGPLNADVQYSINILDSTGKSVYSKDNLTAKGGTDTQTIDFPSNEKYNVQIAVNGLMKEGQQVDKTRNGIARGTVIVPEFPAGAVLAMAGLVAAVLLAQRFAVARRPQSGSGLW